ncbi:phage tail domain-containing protein [Liquorilactobacillus hordei]|uniref:phage tail domain-containing protein n=1 Tax=Liquorilactobacillus hordei TaxID=468911 RepID=UPI0039EAF07C
MPTMWIKRGDEEEFDAGTITSGLKFLGADTNPVLANNYLSDTQADGSIFSYSQYQKSVVNARFWLHFQDYTSYKLAKHDIFKVLGAKGIIRIRTNSEPAQCMYVRSTVFEISPTEDFSHNALFTVPFENPSGYKYSLVNSDVLKTYSTGVWANYGQNLPYNEDTQYTFTKQNNFRVYNASDIPIDPYFQHHELSIIIKHKGTGFTITNKTNGTSYTYFGTMNSSDTLVLQGLSTYKNGIIDSNNSDYGYLKLETGWNDIKVTGATDATITFSFPFIYIA